MIDDVIQQLVLKISSEVLEITGNELSDYEKRVISDGVIFCKEKTPNNYGIVMDAMEKQTQLESDYNYLIYNLSFHLESLILNYRSLYDATFAQLTRSGLPNQAAVEASAMSRDNNKLLNMKNKINRLELVISYLKTESLLIKSKGRLFDAKRSNTF
jgi:hypothetical protein